ncbi:peptide-methionine (S)-S-oxide reductase MsrA [Actinokineospora sp. NBRC 105648]|uniref:peptide-methionine (S)-S-oxide reductase MsrA n=1 Tax=Actinokineospora sp. NBRC 105648 TaxID=3032206 RepID=UPI0024A2741B|nr:peptide-methionine (S)-S-oxide reductase MsrA [Actinokineospora sp. NBRC 105648]GLZ41271.1 peptide methionine sulfoxide reductase MsrA 1 [Actinokineospora sp. NBRC 105648]
MTLFRRDKSRTVAADRALPGRPDPLRVSPHHAVHTDRRIVPPFPEGTRTAVFAMGCFWGPERVFWQVPGVYSTAVGYIGGYTPNPTYEEVCSGLTGHTEAVLVVYDPAAVGYADLLKIFWEGHDPTQGMRQGNDLGTQYRSGAYYADDEQKTAIEATLTTYQQAITAAGHGTITTEIAPVGQFYYAEDYHRQYLSPAKNPNGYCGMGGTGVACAIGLGVREG